VESIVRQRVRTLEAIEQAERFMDAAHPLMESYLQEGN